MGSHEKSIHLRRAFKHFNDSSFILLDLLSLFYSLGLQLIEIHNLIASSSNASLGRDSLRK
jgi:hypothetical protein